MKHCSRCNKAKDISQFKTFKNGKHAKTCSHCRNKPMQGQGFLDETRKFGKNAGKAFTKVANDIEKAGKKAKKKDKSGISGLGFDLAEETFRLGARQQKRNTKRPGESFGDFIGRRAASAPVEVFRQMNRPGRFAYENNTLGTKLLIDNTKGVKFIPKVLNASNLW